MVSESKYFFKKVVMWDALPSLAQLPFVLNLVFHLSTFADDTDVLKNKSESMEEGHVRHKHHLFNSSHRSESDSLRSGRGNTHCSRGHIRRQIDRVSQSRCLESQTKSNHNNPRVQPLPVSGVGYIQSGRYAQVFDTLFTSNLKTDSDSQSRSRTSNNHAVLHWRLRDGPASTATLTLPLWSFWARRPQRASGEPSLSSRCPQWPAGRRQKLELMWKPKPDYQYITLKCKVGGKKKWDGARITKLENFRK